MPGAKAERVMDQQTDNTKPAASELVLSEQQKNVVIGGVLLAMLLAALDQTIVAPAMPTIGSALGHAQYLPWIVTAYLLAATALAPLYGRISDIYGRRPTIMVAIAIFLAGSVISAIAPDMLTLIIGRAVQGIGGGGLFTMSQTIIGDLVPPRERALYAGWISGMWAVASIAGPLLGGAFAEHLHWSLIFWINLPLGVVAVLTINGPLKRLPVAGRRHSIDGWSAALLIVATSLLLLALNWGGSTYPWGSPEILGLLAGSVLGFAALGIRLVKASEPLISLEILGNRVVLFGTLGVFMLQGANIGLAVYLPVYLESVQGLTAGESGLGLLSLLLGTVAGASMSGRLTAKLVHYKRIALFGICISVAAVIVLAVVAASAPLWQIEVLLAIVGIGSGTVFPVTTVSVQNAVDRAHLGVATGVLTFLRSLGSALGVAVLGAVALGYGIPLAGEAMRHHAAAGSGDGFGMIYFVCALMLVLGLVSLVLMPEKPLRGSADNTPPPVEG